MDAIKHGKRKGTCILGCISTPLWMQSNESCRRFTARIILISTPLWMQSNGARFLFGRVRYLNFNSTMDAIKRHDAHSRYISCAFQLHYGCNQTLSTNPIISTFSPYKMDQKVCNSLWLPKSQETHRLL